MGNCTQKATTTAKAASMATLSNIAIQQLTAQGYLVADVEKVIPHTCIKRDLFGFIDLIAIREDETLAVQVTSKSNMAARVTKITEHDNLAMVRKAGWRIQVWGLRKEKDGTYSTKITDLS